MVGKTVLHQLTTGMVLDRSVFATVPKLEAETAIASIRAAPATPLYLVDSAELFFTTANLVGLLSKNDKRYLLVNEGLGGFFTQAQIDALLPAVAGPVIKPAAVKDDDEGLVVNLGPKQLFAPVDHGYAWAPVPAAWSMSGNMSLGPNKIKRKIKNSDGDGTLFWMSPESFEKLWQFASKAWNNVEGAPVTDFFFTGMGKLKATLFDDRVSLGGNYIRRYELEQVAKYRNWDLPQLQAA